MDKHDLMILDIVQQHKREREHIRPPYSSGISGSGLKGT